MPSVELHYQTIGDPNNPPLLIMHGLFGSGRNWQGIARQMKEWHVYLIDMRNHGQSPHSDEMNYQAMADDIGAFLYQHKLGRCPVIAHSMGGKAACWLELNWSESFSKMIIVDMVPRNYSHNFDAILQAMQSVPLELVKNRKEADSYLAQTLPVLQLRQFLLQNLVIEQQQAHWRIDLDIIQDAIPTIVGFPATKGLSSKTPTLFLGGAASNYVLPSDSELIQSLFPNANIGMVADAGHWIHAEQPKVFVEKVCDFLKH